MKPVLDKLPAERRTILFVPVAAGALLLAFIVLAIATPDIYYPIVLSLPIGIAVAYVLLGWPVLTHKDGRPILDPKVKPYLFFGLAPFFALLLYPVVGTPLTKAGLSADLVSYISLAVAASAGITLAYLAVGFPKLNTHLREQYRALPEERRRHFFWPLFVVFFLILYMVLGVASTSFIERYPKNVGNLLSLQPMILLPLCILLAGLAAYLLVGIPRAKNGPVQYVAKFGGKARPRLFVATAIVLGIPFTAILGAILTEYTRVNPRSSAILPADALLPIALILGFAASAGIAAAVWGTPARWRRYEDYEPGIPKRARVTVLLAASLASALVVIAGFGAAGLDIFYGLLAGLLVGTLVALQLTGRLRKIFGRHEDGLVPPIPDRTKPLIFFPVWLGIAFLLFATLTYALPDMVAINLVGGLLVGLLVALVLLELRLFRELLQERREARERRRQFKALRKQRLAEDADDAATQKS